MNKDFYKETKRKKGVCIKPGQIYTKEMHYDIILGIKKVKNINYFIALILKINKWLYADGMSCNKELI